MPEPKQGTNEQGEIFHYSVGAIIEKNGKYLLLDRKFPPLGFAGPAGHIDVHEEPEVSVVREVDEETGLKVESAELLFSEYVDWNWCRSAKHHHWYVYRCQVSGELKPEWHEMSSLEWYSPDQIKELKLEQVWDYWFKKLGIV